MEHMNVFYSKSAIKFLNHVDKNIRENIRNKINGLAKTPPEGDIKPLQGYSEDYFRLRVGKYRVIFRLLYQNNIRNILIVDIGSRGDIYK